MYIPTINSGMDWGSTANTWFYGSNTDDNWTQLYSTGGLSQNTQLSFNFTNNNYYRYYMFAIKTVGSGHKDRTAVASFQLKIENTQVKILV